MGPMDPVRVFVVDEKLPEPCVYRQIPQRNDRQCLFVSSQKEVAAVPELRTVDVVLSSLRIPGVSIHCLKSLRFRVHARAFYSLRIGGGHGWLPVLRLGRQYLGTAAFPPSGFAGVSEQLVQEIRSSTLTLSQVYDETFDFLANPTYVALLFEREGSRDFKRRSTGCGVPAIREFTVETGDAGRVANKVWIGYSSPADRVLKVHRSGGGGDTATSCAQPAHILDVWDPERASRVESNRRN